jgi:hypothetical protein
MSVDVEDEVASGEVALCCHWREDHGYACEPSSKSSIRVFKECEILGVSYSAFLHDSANVL